MRPVLVASVVLASIDLIALQWLTWDGQITTAVTVVVAFALGALSLILGAAYAVPGLSGMGMPAGPASLLSKSLSQFLDRPAAPLLSKRNRAVESQRQVAELEMTHAHLSVTLDCLRDAYGDTVRSLVAALDARDRDTRGHSERVSDLALEVALEMGVPEGSEDARTIQWGSLLHDVGKIAVPDAILRKPDSLTNEEWEIMRAHPVAGYDILRSVAFLAPAADIVLAHHERFDGNGYPARLAGDDIPLGARIFAIADAFDAMTSDRYYRAGVSAEESLAELVKHSGSQFDPAVVRAFLRVYEKKATGAGFGRIPQRPLADSLMRDLLDTIGSDHS
jgi:putative nucleotidyltransferase with HDIG domain